MTYKIQIDDEIRNATPEEIADIEAVKLEAAKKQFEDESKEIAKADLLAKLGITAEEAKLLLS
jgi:hypothetical protein